MDTTTMNSECDKISNSIVNANILPCVFRNTLSITALTNRLLAVESQQQQIQQSCDSYVEDHKLSRKRNRLDENESHEHLKRHKPHKRRKIDRSIEDDNEETETDINEDEEMKVLFENRMKRLANSVAFECKNTMDQHSERTEQELKKEISKRKKELVNFCQKEVKQYKQDIEKYFERKLTLRNKKEQSDLKRTIQKELKQKNKKNQAETKTIIQREVKRIVQQHLVQENNINLNRNIREKLAREKEINRLIQQKFDQEKKRHGAEIAQIRSNVLTNCGLAIIANLQGERAWKYVKILFEKNGIDGGFIEENETRTRVKTLEMLNGVFSSTSKTKLNQVQDSYKDRIAQSLPESQINPISSSETNDSLHVLLDAIRVVNES